jgi:hypothetical protein
MQDPVSELRRIPIPRTPLSSRSLSNFACSFRVCFGLVLANSSISRSHAVSASSAV